jgi:hypothetical protein
MDAIVKESRPERLGPQTERGDLAAAARVASRLFRLVASLRARHGVEIDEAIVYFAVGRLTLEPGQGAMIVVRPTNIASLAEFLAMPRETLRRKLIKLEERELVTRSSAGFTVRDVGVWRRLAELTGERRAEAEA